MAHPLFSSRMLSLLTAPERWRLVAPTFPPEMPAARGSRHEAWAQRNTHAHTHREILFVFSGRGYQSFAGRCYRTLPGTVFLFDTMIPHDSFYPPWHGPAEHLWLNFVYDQCAARFLRIAAHEPVPPRQWRGWHTLDDLGISSIRPLFPEETLSAPLARMRCAGALALIMSALIERTGRRPSEERTENLHAGVIGAIARHIEANHGRGCRLESLARVAGYSKYHFLRLFHEHAGMSLRKCVDRARQRALRDMLSANLPQKTIAAELGFAHPSALCRWRRRQERGRTRSEN